LSWVIAILLIAILAGIAMMAELFGFFGTWK
jgi:hypothetical protein